MVGYYVDVDDGMWVEGRSLYVKRVASNGRESVVSEYERLQQPCRFFVQLASE